jgi:hypothetical protein
MMSAKKPLACARIVRSECAKRNAQSIVAKLADGHVVHRRTALEAGRHLQKAVMAGRPQMAIRLAVWQTTGLL